MKTDTNYTTTPFDLEKALAGHPLVTRDGRDVSGFKFNKQSIFRFPCSVIIRGGKYAYTKDGCFLGHQVKDNFDLFLKIEAPAEPDYTCTRYRAGVMIAFADGAEIEERDISGDGEWESCDPQWDFCCFDYRVAPPKPAKPRLIGYYVMQEKKTLPMIELTPEVIAALEAAGIEYKKGGVK